MKRVLSLALALALCLTLFGCSGQTGSSSSDASSQSSVSSQTEGAASGVEDTSSQKDSSQGEDSSAVSETSQVDTAGLGTAVVAALKGPTAMGMVKMMSDDAAKEEPAFDFSIYASADEITPKLVQGELDIAAVPANLASVLYNNTQGQVQVLAINTLGVLYLVESGDTAVIDFEGFAEGVPFNGSPPRGSNLRPDAIAQEIQGIIPWRSGFGIIL